MYKQILIPDELNHSIELPENLYGKKIEITVTEIVDHKPFLPEKSTRTFLDDIEKIPDFPSVEEIRNNGWPNKW